MSGKQEKLMRRAMNGSGSEAPPKLQNLLGLDAGRFAPLADQVLLEVELETESRGGIILPAAVQQRELGGLPVGRVLAVGPEVKRVTVGDYVLAPPREAAKIDVLLWLVPDAKLLTKVAPRAEQLIQPVA